MLRLWTQGPLPQCSRLSGGLQLLTMCCDTLGDGNFTDLECSSKAPCAHRIIHARHLVTPHGSSGAPSRMLVLTQIASACMTKFVAMLKCFMCTNDVCNSAD